MADRITIGASAAVRSLCDERQGISEYLEEQYPDAVSPEKVLVLPLRLSGWVWRKEGPMIFRRYRRRFYVFEAQQTALFVFSDENIETRKLLQHLVLTRATLLSRDDRVFDVMGYVGHQEVLKETAESGARRAEGVQGQVLRGSRQAKIKLEEERFKAVSAKACCVWTHCFKHRMKSYDVRRQETDHETRKKEGTDGTTAIDVMLADKGNNGEMKIGPRFVFEDATKNTRRRLLPQCNFWGSNGCGLFVHSKSSSRSRDKVAVKTIDSVERKASEASKSGPSRVQFDQSTGSIFGQSTIEAGKKSPTRATTESSPQRNGKTVGTHSPTLPLELSCIMSEWESEELFSHRMDFDAIVLRNMLAAGACGEVWHALYRSQEIVVKKLPNAVMMGAKFSALSTGDEVNTVCRQGQAILDFVQEIRIMSRLEHNRIVEFRGVAMGPGNDLRLIMEFLPRGDLRVFLHAVKRKEKNALRKNDDCEQFQSIWTWTKQQWRLAIDIIEGLVYLHSLNPPLVHGDLKSANVLLRSDLRAKLTDFGLSRYLVSNEGEYLKQGRRNDGTVDMSGDGSRACGTGRWMAPELIKCAAQTSIDSDVYAFGIVLSEIDTCELPFHDREKPVAYPFCPLRSSARQSSHKDVACSLNESHIVHKIVGEGWKPTFRVTCPESIKKLAQECLSPDPKKRPTSLAVAHRLRKAAGQRERPEVLAAQAKAATLLHIR
uniref:Protein kinase domain-containing protein n=1 Tax=Peronospora matthiolae TaxID=2874970 RepID=A0AAV1TM24_9STRA